MIKHTHSRTLTKVAFHPSDPYLATGDDEGNITLWHGYDSSNVVTSHMHWHAHAVSALAFCDDGSYLLSGGEEAVLVLWQLDTGLKQFLPRLGSTLNHIKISPDGNRFAIAGADNCIRLISAVSSRVESVIQGLAHAHTHPLRKGIRRLQTGLVLHPTHPWVVLQGMPGSIQFYDVMRDRHMGEVNVCPRNLVSRANKQLPNSNRVDLVAFDKSGDWLATVDRLDTGRSDQVCLKVWARNQNEIKTPYLNHTRVDAPHKSKISCLAFHPTRPLLVSASTDGTFKLWEPQTRTSSQRTLLNAPAWAVRAEGAYRHGYPIYDGQFSPDGSLLALGCGQVITLWDPLTLTLLRTLCHPSELKSPIRFLRFIPQSALLVVATSHALYMWDLLSLSISWSYSLPVAGLSIHGSASGARLAVASPLERSDGTNEVSETDPCTLLLFDPSNHLPIAQWHVVDLKLEFSKDCVKHAAVCLLESEEDGLMLVYRNMHKQLVALHCDQSPSNQKHTVPLMPTQLPQHSSSLFEQLYTLPEAPRVSRRQSSEYKSSSSRSLSSTARFSNPELFDAPSHVLPPVSIMLSAFMELVCKKRALPDTETASTRASKRVKEEEAMLDSDEHASIEETVTTPLEQLSNIDASALEWDERYLTFFSTREPAAAPVPKAAVVKDTSSSTKNTDRRRKSRSTVESKSSTRRQKKR